PPQHSPDAPKGPSEEVLLLREIRDSLKNDTLKTPGVP
ncbi:large conductance mechanosensitive channel protein MscL, partial [Xanthomonas hortorum pv. gardneri]